MRVDFVYRSFNLCIFFYFNLCIYFSIDVYMSVLWKYLYHSETQSKCHVTFGHYSLSLSPFLILFLPVKRNKISCKIVYLFKMLSLMINKGSCSEAIYHRSKYIRLTITQSWIFSSYNSVTRASEYPYGSSIMMTCGDQMFILE